MNEASGDAPVEVPTRRRRRLTLGLLVVAIVALAAVERGARYVAALGSPTRLARWIWAPDEWWRRAEPAAFDVVCDFRLEALPEAATLAVQGDEEFVAWLNARWVGAGRYVPGAPLAAYDVRALLLPGGNRLVARVRSARGEGGFLASIRAGRGQLLASGRDCRVLKPAGPGIVQGWFPLPGEILPKVWGLPPTGRWGAPVVGAARPPAPLEAADAARRVLEVHTERMPGGVLTLFEWPAETHGILRLHLGGQAGETGLLFLGTAIPNARDLRSDRILVTAEGDDVWMGEIPKGFRFALVAGLSDVRAADVLPEPGPPAPPAALRGAFGLAPPPSRSPVEEEIRSRLGTLPPLEIPASAATGG